MQEDNIIVEEFELEYDTVDIVEESDEVIPQETVDVIEVDDIQVFTVDTDEAFSALGEQNEQLKHQLLTGREASDQHPITAITGLRDELDNIEALQTVYSNEKGNADYYEWEDSNILIEDRVGYFVTVCEDTKMIKLCTSDTEIFGVTVDGAAFIGGQDDVVRDYKYGLVAYSGIANVRCELDVEVGDNVVSNNHGMAEKADNNYGCKVISLHDINGVRYATIALNLSIHQMNLVGEELKGFDDRLGVAEINIVSAMNVANQAYNKANEIDFDGLSQGISDKVDEALSRADEALTNSENAQASVQEALKYSAEAQAKSDAAVTAAETIRTEAVEVANTTLAEVNDLVKDLEPLSTWKDSETGNVGAEYLANYIDNGVATKAEVYTVEKLTEDNKSAITKSADKIQTMVSSVDKYSVGEYSQAYGLTREQAKSILKEGYVYIPTKHSATKISHSETFLDETEPNEFTPGWYYVWGINDQGVADWIERVDGGAWISNTMPAVSNEKPKYWYIDSNEAPEGYEPHALYMWDDEKWQQVSLLSGNANNRVASMIRQTANEIAAEVSDARGDVSALQLKVAENTATASLVAKVVDTEGNIKGASIVQAVNASGSSSTISADHIVLNGYNISNGNGSFQINEGGHMIATGGSIAGWQIGGNWISKAREVKRTDNNGNVIDGRVAVNNEGTYTVLMSSQMYDSNTQNHWSPPAFAVQKVTNNSIEYPFLVRSNGELTATKGYIANWVIESSALSSTRNYETYDKDNNGNIIKTHSWTADVRLFSPTSYWHPNISGRAADVFWVMTTEHNVLQTDGTTKDVTTWPLAIHMDGTIVSKKLEAHNAKMVTGNGQYATFSDSRLAFWGTSTKPHVSIGYASGSNNALIILGTGSNDTATDSYTGRFYISKDTSGVNLTLYNGNTNSSIGSRIYFRNDCIGLQVGNAFCELDETRLYALNAFLRYGTMPVADE